MKENVFILLQKYLEGRVYGVESLVKNGQAVQKYKLYTQNKKKMNTSFITNKNSSPFRSDTAKRLKVSTKSQIEGFENENRSADFGDHDFISHNTSPLLKKQRQKLSSANFKNSQIFGGTT